MLTRSLNKTVLSVISIASLVSSLAMAQLTPGPGGGGQGGGGNPPPKYNPCAVPTDPNCKGGGHGGNPGHNPGNPGGGGIKPGNPGGNPGHNPGYPGNPGGGGIKPGPSNPTYPTQPTYPTYPSQPNYPSYNYGPYTVKAINGNLGRCTVRTNVSGWANQIYLGGNFAGNYDNGAHGYNENAQLENALRTHVQNGNCGYIGGYDPAPSYPDYPYYPYPSDSYPDYNDNTIVRRVVLNRNIYNQSIDLRRLFNLDENYTGYRVVSVSASTTPNSPSTTIANLVVNGYIMASERNPGYEIYLSPMERVRLDNSGTRVSLGITGSTYIQELQIELSRY
jgi:hypothetical protein